MWPEIEGRNEKQCRTLERQGNEGEMKNARLKKKKKLIEIFLFLSPENARMDILYKMKDTKEYSYDYRKKDELSSSYRMTRKASSWKSLTSGRRHFRGVTTCPPTS